MGYYALAPLIAQGKNKGRAPVIKGATIFNSIYLGKVIDKSLVWIEDNLIDARLTKLADDKSEVVADSTKTELEKLGFVIKSKENFLDCVTNCLLDPPKFWEINSLKPQVNGELVIYLGPGSRGQNKFFEQKVNTLKHSKFFADNFNRADAALNGSILSNSTASWVNSDGFWNIVSNLALFTAIPNDTLAQAILNTQGDTDNLFSQADLSTYTRPSGDFLGATVYACLDSTASLGYTFDINNDLVADAYNSIYAISSETELAFDNIAVTSGLLRINRNGSSVEGLVNGVVKLGPVTDSSEASGAGNRYCGFKAYYAGAAATTRSVGFDNFKGGDLNAPWSKLPIVGAG